MDGYYCNLCDKTIQFKNKKKHLNTKLLLDLSESINKKYCAKTPKLIEIEKKYENIIIIIIKALNFNKLYVNGNYSLLILLFMLNQKRMYDNGLRCGLIKKLIRKIDYFRGKRLRFSHILEMNITSIPNLNLTTFEHSFIQPMQMIERVLIKKLYKNPELVKMLKDVNLTLPYIRDAYKLPFMKDKI